MPAEERRKDLALVEQTVLRPPKSARIPKSSQTRVSSSCLSLAFAVGGVLGGSLLTQTCPSAKPSHSHPHTPPYGSHMQVASGSGTLASSYIFVHPIAVSSVSSRAHALGDTLARRQSVRPMKSSTSEGDHAVPVTRQSTDQRVRAPFHRWEREFLVMQTAATFKCGPEGGSCGGEISWTDGTRLPIAARIHLLHTSCMKGA